jgi:hypothetical protein
MNRRDQRAIAGAFAGLVATLPMTALMTLWHRRLPPWKRDSLPPAQITSTLLSVLSLDDDVSPSQETALTIASHFAYGATMGGLFGLLSADRTPAQSAVAGNVFGTAVWAASYFGWLPAAGLYRSPSREPRERHLLMLAAHLAWGTTLGLVTELTRSAIAVRPAQLEHHTKNKHSELNNDLNRRQRSQQS